MSVPRFRVLVDYFGFPLYGSTQFKGVEPCNWFPASVEEHWGELLPDYPCPVLFKTAI